MNEPLTQSVLATARGEVAALGKELETAHAEIERLKGALAKAEACCAEMRTLLQGWRDYNQADIPRTGEAMEEAGEQFTKLWTDMDKALSTDCGSALLKELEELRGLVKPNGNGLIAENSQLRAEVQKLREDKERLDWLALNFNGFFSSAMYRPPINELRQAIDAARKKGKE